MTNLQEAGRVRYWVKGLMYRYLPGMMTCLEFENFLVDYFDNDLTVEQKTVFEKHLKTCRECKEYLAAYKRTMEIAASGRFSSYEIMPKEIPEDLISAILDARKF